MTRRLMGAAVLVGAAVSACLPESVVGRVAYTVCFALVVVAAWAGVRRPSVGGRLPWAMVASAVTSWLLGDLVWDFLALAGYELTVGLPDVLWLSGYGFMGAAFVLMVRQRAPGQARAGLQDGLTVTTAAALATWQFIVSPGMDTTVPVIEIVVGSLYPLGDIALLGSVLFLVLSPGRHGMPTRLLVGGTALTLVGDVAFAVLPNYWSEVDVERLNGLLLIANAVVVAAALHRDRDELVTPARVTVATLHPARVLFLGLAVLTAPLMAVTRGELGLAERLPLLAGTVVTIGFSLARFTGAVREQARVQQLLAHLADHDTLTGLANRRVLGERLDRDFRPAEDTAVFYVDLDGFKEVNDTYGHAAGDTVLVEVARRLRAAVRPDDVVARLGGDEFAVLCLRLSADARRQLADRLVLVASVPIVVDGRPVRVGASVGVATAAGCRDGEDLISRADRAMFTAKQGGRGRAVIA
ncbi:MAG TPA: GGDEF domain-containing protein [Micromonosporaceae bacterium]|nr:GGDEF domain-containing protein [Micromonosporaceae bacterium]